MKIKKILIVDNNVTIVKLVSRLLTEAGYEVGKAHDGIEALDYLDQESILPDVILLDLVMPKIDGQRLTRILKGDKNYSHIPIIILSGIAAEEDGKLLASGADAYIAKGKMDETFRHVLDTIKWIEEREAPQEKRELVLGIDSVHPREMTRELLLIKEHFDSMFNLMQEGVIEINQDHRVLFINPAAQRLLCTEDHSLFGKPVQELFDDSTTLGAYLKGLPRGEGKTVESVQLTCGQFVTRAIASPFFHDDKYIGAIIILQDITSLVEREKSLEELMAAIVRNAPIGLCLFDAEGRVLVANKALTAILRQPLDWNPKGLNILDYLSMISPTLDEALRRILVLSPGRMIAHMTDYYSPDERIRQVLNFTGTALDVAGESRFLLLVEDVTERSLLEENLRRANEEMTRANTSKSTFLSMVSHELRTPLSVVRGYISLILEGKIGPCPDKVREALQVADKRGRHLQNLIEELLDLSRIESGRLSIKKENLEARKHIRETLAMFQDELARKNISLEMAIPDDTPPVLADHDKIHQIFTNLISNAIKFSNTGGTVTVTARPSGDRVEFSIGDSGIGIPADRLDKIFDKFYQVDSSDTRLHPGTGLGLSIVKMILGALNGSIHVTSEVGKGTTFVFTLPVGAEVPPSPKRPPLQEETPVQEEIAGTTKRILVVEDDPDTQELIRLFLSGEPYEVIVTKDGFDGLKEFYHHPPDLILADALLPLMSGLDLCRIVKNKTGAADIPVIILSAAAQEDEIRRGYEMGAEAYLIKPISPVDLIEVIRKHT